MRLMELNPLHEQPGFPEAFAKVVKENHGKVCSRCGLEMMGHGPESRWLGHDKHPFDPVKADDAMMERADSLSREAYRMHNMTMHEARNWVTLAAKDLDQLILDRERMSRDHEVSEVIERPYSKYPWAFRFLTLHNEYQEEA